MCFEGDAFDVVHRHHSGRRQVPVDARNDEGGLIRHQLCIAFEKARFLNVVRFLRKLALGFAGDRVDIEIERQQVEQPEQGGYVVDVAGDRACYAWVLDLEREVAPIAGASAVHLPDRGGRERLIVELRKARLPALPQFAPEDPVQLRGRHRRSPRAQYGQRLRKLGRQHIFALEGNDLAELHRRTA